MAKRNFWNADKITSLSAMLISLVTLIVFVYQTTLIRQQQYISVMPYISIYNQGTGSGNFSIVLNNDGLGPAFIESTVITYKGKKYEMDLPTFLNSQIEAMDSIPFTYSNIYPGRMVTPGEEVRMIQFIDNPKAANDFLKVIVDIDLDFELIYQSIYKERWMLGENDNLPQKLPRKRKSVGFN